MWWWTVPDEGDRGAGGAPTRRTRRPAARAGRWLAVAALAASTALAACGGTAAQSGPAAAPATAADGVSGGAVPAALASAAGPAAASAVPLFVQESVVRGAENLTAQEVPAESCVQNSRFAHNQQIIWRIRVLDPSTGHAMDNHSLKSVTVALADGTRLQARYGNHGSSTAQNPATSFWTAAWTVPAGYPTGTLGYTVTAVATGGRQGSLIPFNVPASLLQITSAVQPVAKQGAKG